MTKKKITISVDKEIEEWINLHRKDRKASAFIVSILEAVADPRIRVGAIRLWISQL